MVKRLPGVFGGEGSIADQGGRQATWKEKQKKGEKEKKELINYYTKTIQDPNNGGISIFPPVLSFAHNDMAGRRAERDDRCSSIRFVNEQDGYSAPLGLFRELIATAGQINKWIKKRNTNAGWKTWPKETCSTSQSVTSEVTSGRLSRVPSVLLVFFIYIQSADEKHFTLTPPG